jgi:hypothetical protein
MCQSQPRISLSVATSTSSLLQVRTQQHYVVLFAFTGSPVFLSEVGAALAALSCQRCMHQHQWFSAIVYVHIQVRDWRTERSN